MLRSVNHSFLFLTKNTEPEREICLLYWYPGSRFKRNGGVVSIMYVWFLTVQCAWYNTLT